LTSTPTNEIRVQRIALVVGIALLLMKFVAYGLTNSNTILTDALESIVNVVAGAFALYSIILASKPKDEDHPYGHGKIEFISAGFEGILIILAGVLIMWKSVFNLFEPAPLHQLNIGLVLIAISTIVNYGLGFWLEQTGKKSGSLTLQADGAHLKADAYTSLAIIIGLIAIMITGIELLDSLVAMAMALFICYTGVKLMRKSLAGIMDEADSGIINDVVKLLATHRRPCWVDMHNLRVIQYGSKLHIDCHITLPYYYTLSEVHEQMEEVSHLVNTEFGKQVEFFIHPDPCVETSCKLCILAECPVRQHTFEATEEWNTANLTRNKKHGLDNAEKI
jgi:cation diffusion facilitator family transporter